MTVLGIESSCDETGAAIVKDSRLLSNVVASSLDLHIPFGGVVPEIAARSHIEVIIPVIEQALKEAKADWEGVDAIAVTQGPGLLGSLLIGVLTARTLAIAKQKPLYAVNHVEAHVYAAFLEDKKPEFPLLALIVSGGHSQLVLFRDHFDYQVLGRTGDDAVGEAFDKVAKILGLPYPGGPSIAQAAKQGNPEAVRLPIAKTENKYDFSFSGLKTAVLRAAQDLSGNTYDFPSSGLPEALSEAQKADVAASFQQTAIKTLVGHLEAAEKQFKPRSIVIAGGVAANQALREAVDIAFPARPERSRRVIYPDFKLCTDNAAMVAALGSFMTSHKRPAADPYSLEPTPGLKM
jgi:N6-L-threonylcarbamoyladenine synthase